jgi:hypothetical protein
MPPQDQERTMLTVAVVIIAIPFAMMILGGFCELFMGDGGPSDRERRLSEAKWKRHMDDLRRREHGYRAYHAAVEQFLGGDRQGPAPRRQDFISDDDWHIRTGRRP